MINMQAVTVTPDENDIPCKGHPIPSTLLDPGRFLPDYIAVCSGSCAVLTTSCLRCLVAGMSVHVENRNVHVENWCL